MRKPIVLVAILASSLTLSGVAYASIGAGKKAPVKLDGQVNNHGRGKVRGGEVEIEADDLYFEKTFIKGKKGETVSVTITNEGSLQHTFTIDSQDIDETIDTGDNATVEITIPKNGKPAVAYCRFHESSGMQMAFYSKAGKKAKTSNGDDKDSGTPSGYNY
jgi:plastocyanin